MKRSFEELEKALTELESQIEKVRLLPAAQTSEHAGALGELEAQKTRLITQLYGNLSGWDKTCIARDPRRPYSLDFIRLMCGEFLELHGDHLLSDDGAVVGGIARLGERWVTVIGHQKGRDAQERHHRNFGYARPGGYRKALRLMRLSAKFGRPILCLVDTPGADCSVVSEEQGISESIARNIHEMFLLPVPILVAVTGEGGSGGALGIGVGDRVLMLEHAVYSVIAPEGCAAILWRDSKRGADAAHALRLTAEDARQMGIVDEIVPEPLGSAHRDFDAAARALKQALESALDELADVPSPTLLDRRYERFRRLGQFTRLESPGE